MDIAPTILKDYSLIIDSEQVGSVAARVAQYPEFALDFETTGLDFNRASVHGLSIATLDQEWYITGGAEKKILTLLPDLVKTREVAFHNAVFDLHFLNRHGIRPPKIYDTMVAQFLINENERLGLKSLAYTQLGVTEALPDFKELLHETKRTMQMKRIGDITIYDVPLNKLAPYGARDARLTYMLKQKTLFGLEKEGLKDYFYQFEMPFVYVLLDMEESGFVIDQPLLHVLELEFTQERNTVLTDWNQITGGINPNSDVQLRDYFYKQLKYRPSRLTDKGQASVDMLSLTRLLDHDKNGAVAALLKYRKLDKLLSTYIYAFQMQLYNGRLYGNFNNCGTETGRLSSSDPNLQNIPAKGELGHRLRYLFTVLEGYDFLDADQSQLELRIIAHYSKDPTLVKVFQEGGDPHQMTADLCHVDRKTAKPLNYGMSYGAGPRTLADTIEKSGVPRPDIKTAAEYLDRLDLAYPFINRWKKKVIQYARELGFVRTIWGRKRRLPDLNSREQGLRAAAEREGINAIIQGSAADILKWSMLKIAPELSRFSAKMLSQVHDELCFESPKAATPELAAQVKEKMEAAAEFFNLRVKLVAEPHAGPNWGAAKDD
jgi:DNA polymerase-1